jgi:hypothetical protein
MYKIGLPLCKSGPFMSKDLGIPKEPDLPASRSHHLHEKWFSKTSFSRLHNSLDIIARSPSDLEVVPNTLAKIAIKE